MAAKNSIESSLIQIASFQVAQAAADDVVDLEIATGISTAATFGWEIKRIEILLDNYSAAPLATDMDWRFQVQRGASGNAFLARSSEDLICEMGFSMPTIAGSVGNPIIPKLLCWNAPENYVVASPYLTFHGDTVGTGVTATLGLRIFYFPVQLTELELLRMLAS